MRQVIRVFFAVLLLVLGFSVMAQDANKTDINDLKTTGDPRVNIGEMPLTGVGAHRTRISNASTVATDSSTKRTGVVGSDTQLQSGASRSAPFGEFQKFVQESTGRSLPIYGSDFFSNAPSTFAPILNSPIPAEYALGPGDEVLIRGWGTVDIDFRATIDRNGLITIPAIGAVPMGGVKAGNAESVIRGAIDRLYKGVSLSVTFGQLRAITVYVVGQANKPGTYTVSSLSTLVTALFASGGPNAIGSMRRVQLKRGGQAVAILDLYAFLAKGDKSADVKLLDGDTIFIPAAFGHVALVGKVNNPAIYELRSANEVVGEMLEIAGGLPIVADPRRVFLERIDVTNSHPRTVEELALDAQGLKKILKNGDVLNVTSITPEFLNAVVLRGNVDQAIRVPFRSGMRVRDLIPSREYLMTRASLQRQNNTVISNDVDRGGRESGDAGNGGEVRDGHENRNGPALTAGRNDVSGSVPSTIASRIGNLIDEINWDYAVIERLNKADLSVSLMPFNLGKIFEEPTGPDNVLLMAGDTVTIFSQKDVLVPLDKRRVFVRVEGEVHVPGIYQMTPGENLHGLLARAGGPTRNAYLFGTEFYREQVRKEQEVNLDKVIGRLDVQLRNEQSRATVQANFGSLADAQMAEARSQGALQAARESVERLRRLRPTGRIAFGLDPHERSFNRLPQLKLENGDRLVVPSRPEFVHIFGAVNSEASPLWQPGKRLNQYLADAGLTPEADVSNAFIIRGDGSVASVSNGNWFSMSHGDLEVMAGDSIVVPERLTKESFWSRFTIGTREWAKILADFGLGAAAIKVLR